MQYVVTLFVMVLALGVLGIQVGLLVTAITIMIGAFGLVIGLALGLGARTIVYHILAGYYVRQRYQPGQTITLGQISGEVSGTGSVNTVVTTDEASTIVPNGVLLEATVRAAAPRPRKRVRTVRAPRGQPADIGAAGSLGAGKHFD